MSKTQVIDTRDQKIIRLLQGDFPLVSEPYKVLADEIGMAEDELLARIMAMRAEKKIRKMGAVLRHREVGFTANALCVWDVPDECVDDVAMRMAEHARVSHCYDRNREVGWRYNLYTMIHGFSCAECEAIAAELAAATGIEERCMLYTKREWKKTSMKYFTES